MAHTQQLPFYKQVLEVLFPPSVDELILRNANPNIFTHPTPTLYRGVYTLLPYADPAVRAAIHLAKYHHHHYAFSLLGASVATYLSQTTTTPTIIPIPLSRIRERKRGYNQVTEILKQAKHSAPELIIDTRSLQRHRHTPPQTSLDRNARQHNLENAFSVSRPHRIKDTHLILIDDVTTTGSTLAAGAAALAAHSPASITSLAIAH